MSAVIQSGSADALVIQSERSVVVAVPGGETVVARQPVPPTVVVTRGIPGPRGAQGLPGQSGASYLTYLADGALGGNRVVRATTAGKVGYVDPSDPAQAHAAIGLTMGAAADSGPINVQFSGEMSEPGWAWVPNLPIFAGANGVPTQTPPATGFQAAIGVATSATTMVIQIKSPIVL
ncbi:MAG: hypothetical protein ACK4OE_04470 [Acidovorax sp.]|uniref:hypothetical protein n=1 Tax=Acidovorax sp. TaxID=1872122 RepID=UPI00391CF007